MIPIAQPLISDREKQLVLEVLDSGMLAAGEKVVEFEEKFAHYIGQKFAVAASSGTTALHIALEACGVKQGDKVITTPFSFIATANSILFCGAQPVFCDVDEQTFNISIDSLRALLKREKDIKALLIVHLYGMSCDMDAVLDLVREHNLILIEDCAQAHGTSFKGTCVGSFGDASIFSFYPTKNMTTSEGGIVLTGKEYIYKKAQLLRNHGITGDYEHSILGYNYRMTDIAAAIGIGQLERLDGFIKNRRANAHYLNEQLNEIPGIRIPHVPSSDYFHVYNQYTLRVLDNRAGFINSLKENGIGHKVFYPRIIPEQIFYQEQGYCGGDFPSAMKVSREVISIPVHPALNGRDLKRIVESIGEYCKGSFVK